MDTNSETNIEIKTTPRRPTVVTIAAILLIVLTLFVTGLGIASQFGLGGSGFGNRPFITGQNGNRNFTPPNGFPFNGLPSNGAPSTGFPNDQTGQGGTTTFNFNRQRATGLASVLRFLQPVMIGLDVVLLVLAGVAVIGLFKSKRWGSILAIVVAALVVLLTIPGMLRIFSPITLVENLLRILMGVAVIVLLLLPSARRSPATYKAGEPVEVERVVR